MCSILSDHAPTASTLVNQSLCVVSGILSIHIPIAFYITTPGKPSNGLVQGTMSKGNPMVTIFCMYQALETSLSADPWKMALTFFCFYNVLAPMTQGL